VADFKKLRGQASAKAALGAAKDAARRAFDDLTMTDEQKAIRAAEEAQQARIRKWKWIAGGVVAVLVFLAVMSILAKLWAWIVLLAVIAAVGYAGFWFVTSKLKPKVEVAEVREKRELPAARIEAPEEAEDFEAREREAEQAERHAAEARRAAAAAKEQAIEDELAALKAKNKPKI
jgi:hypothetical protein